MGRKYPPVKSGEWIQPRRRGYRMCCCDCGLVHALNFRLHSTKRGKFIQMQAFRDNRATAMIRRHMKASHG